MKTDISELKISSLLLSHNRSGVGTVIFFNRNLRVNDSSVAESFPTPFGHTSRRSRVFVGLVYPLFVLLSLFLCYAVVWTRQTERRGFSQPLETESASVFVWLA